VIGCGLSIRPIHGSLAAKEIRILGIASPLENRISKDRTLAITKLRQ
jgi:hypothetical protein